MQLTIKSIQQNEAGILKAGAFPCSTQQICLRNKNIWLGYKTLAAGLKDGMPQLQLHQEELHPLLHPCSLRAFMQGCRIGKDLTTIPGDYKYNKYQHSAGDRQRTHGEIKKTTLSIPAAGKGKAQLLQKGICSTSSRICFCYLHSDQASGWFSGMFEARAPKY